ncbi:MAG: AlkZ family DNA glycosylase [Anaerolineae bacterium]|nr:AlkZ family DNA glycosylase [Anaerolineae bacterium]
MMERSDYQVRTLRIRAQSLHPRTTPDRLVDVVRAVGGIQAQLTPAMLLALRARISGLTIKDVATAIDQDRTVVRTWAMRGTLHLLARDDVQWMVALFGPIFAAKGKRRRLQLGLTDELCDRGLHAIREILRDSEPLTRGQLVEQLADHGVTLDRKSQAPIHLIGLAAHEGIVCLGPERPNGESTYVLMDRWLGKQGTLERQTALTQLARRYLDGYGPASLKDFAGWSGLPMTDARQGWESALASQDYVEARLDGASLYLPRSAEIPPDKPDNAAPIVCLLPAFDTYLLGYANRNQLVRPQHQPEVYHGGQIVPVVLVDGLAAGVWRYERRGKRMTIRVHPFDTFDAPLQQGIAAEAEAIGRFFGAAVKVMSG